MDLNLTPNQCRVIGSLIEKEITTPDQYPLSLNALVNACNQKSNRDPVMELDEFTVQETLDELIKKHLATDKAGFGGRVAKYKHRFCNAGFGGLEFSAQELGVVCVLLLRGPQTPGELRTRTNRLCRFADAEEVESTLQRLMEREDGPFVAPLPREAGKREVRYAHLFGGDLPAVDVSEAREALSSGGRDEGRIARLEEQVGELRLAIDALRAELGLKCSGDPD